MAREWRTLEAGQKARLCIFDVVSGGRRVLYETRDAVIEAPNWTPDGRFLIYNQEGLLYRIPVDAGPEPAPLEMGGVRGCNNDHVVSPDGKFVYASGNDGHLYEISLETGDARRVSNGHARPFRYFVHGISPDGSTLTYTGAEEVDGDAFGALNIFTIPVAGGGDTQLTRSAKPSDGSEYSPDGSWIYFNSEMSSSTAGHAQLFRMRTGGSDLQQLTHDERVNWFPHLSPDGSQVAYLSYEPGTTGHPANKSAIIRSMDPAGRHTQDLVSLFGGQGTINVNSWAPDSRGFAFVDYPFA
jgi:Tol biopolymer transport system component